MTSSKSFFKAMDLLEEFIAETKDPNRRLGAIYYFEKLMGMTLEEAQQHFRKQRHQMVRRRRPHQLSPLNSQLSPP